jgi:hypothetical protein
VAQFRLFQPHRHLAFEHATLARGIAARALAGNDKNEARAACLRVTQEAYEREMRLTLGQPVQIDAPVDRLHTASELLLGAAREWCEWRRHR